MVQPDSSDRVSNIRKNLIYVLSTRLISEENNIARNVGAFGFSLVRHWHFVMLTMRGAPRLGSGQVRHSASMTSLLAQRDYYKPVQTLKAWVRSSQTKKSPHHHMRPAATSASDAQFCI